MSRSSSLTVEAAEAIALQGLNFLVAEPERIADFLAESGIGPGQIRAAAREPRFLAGVLAHISTHEPLLVAFAQEADITPALVERARTSLGDTPWEREVP